MTRNEKRIEKFLKNPESLRFSQIEKILSDFGFYRIETKGSHAKFKREWEKRDIVVPIHSNDCKPFYKRMIAEILRTFSLK